MLGGETIACKPGEVVRREGLSLEVRAGDRAALWIEGPCRVELSRLTVTGDRKGHPEGQALPPYDRRFVDHYRQNGVVIVGAREVVIADATFREIAGFAVLVSRATDVRISRSRFLDSGSVNAKGRNNTTGGVLLEDGTARFTVEECQFTNILGNAVWTHSRYKEARNGPGMIRGNQFDTVARDAIQVGHASSVVVRDNVITRVGFPVEAIDVEGGGTPVGVDTAGNVDTSDYAGNRMTEINGKCFDLDGFHHGSVSGNRCVNTKGPEAYPFGHYAIVMNNTNPDMQSTAIRIEDNVFEGMRFGGIFVIGSGHVIRRNKLSKLHLSHCSNDAVQPGCSHFEGEPDLLRSGIYLGKRAERPAITRANTIEANEISGWRMDRRCIGYAPGVNPRENRVSGNVCRHQAN